MLALDHMMIVDPMNICVETLRWDIWCHLVKNFTELICINPQMALYLILDKFDLGHCCICGS